MNSGALSQWLGIDKAVVFGLASRVWQLVAGPVTAILITGQFSPELQGYYYTFSGALAWQAFVELGLHAIIIYFVSHEWQKLSLDENNRLSGDQHALGRLLSFGRQLNRWYSGVACAFVVLAGTGGLAFFWPGDPQISWIPQWLSLVLLTSGTLWLIPYVAILEGCNQVETVNRYRFWLGVAGNITVWTCLLMDAQLWTIVASAAVRFLGDFSLVAVRYRNFFRRFLTPFEEVSFPWKEEVWPMQWRAAVQSIAGYFGLAFVIPIIFWYHDSALAGQMGLSWTLLVVIQGVGQAWIQPRIPTFGMLIAKRDFLALNQLFRRVLLVSSSIILLGVFAFAGFVWGLTAWQAEIDSGWFPATVSQTLTHLRRGVIDPASILIFGVGITCSHIASCLGIYIRAHRYDPLVIFSTLTSAVLGILIYVFGRYFAVQGAAFAYCGVFLIMAVPGHIVVLKKVAARFHVQTDVSSSSSAPPNDDL
ncbi:MAG: hypothetical protein HQ518_16125 [Rhodopirellula sp.]|nr:hypothetical protein [Rhodopirellula sp.]